ncbi:hypothetical protein LDG_8137 [Legionella drancourtii LLAP12]|uniref:Uncharacterized protein n=2 Tax=Legionella drancourtii TaxID=168933 RepID=G9ES64_9GAMM|nr:hypothetical protein LDG_8137 [Legionella drancourtii LLAP12]
MRVLFERFKGWLGFENHCSTSKVEMTCAKIAYAGYLKGFHSKTLNTFAPPIISHGFINLVNTLKSRENSTTLQHLLVSHYKNHFEDVPPLASTNPANYPFGQVFISEALHTLLPAIDPQDDTLINRAIHYMLSTAQSPVQSRYVIPSKFASHYAYALIEHKQRKNALNQSVCQEALVWDPEVDAKFKTVFIEFYFIQTKKDPAAVDKALRLINALASSPNTEEHAAAIKYIKDNFDVSKQLSYLKNYPALRMKIAQFYLAEAQKERDKWSISKLFMGNQMLPLLTHAVSLEPQVLEQNNTIHTVAMKEEWALFQFSLAIKEKRFQDAETLYAQNPCYQFNKNDLDFLVKYYDTELVRNKKIITTELAHKNTQQAQEAAEKQIALAKKRTQLQPQDASKLFRAILDCAETLVTIDEILHPDIAQTDLEQLDRAQNYLNECKLNLDQKDLNKIKINIFNQLVQRKIDCLIIKLGVPLSCEHWEERREFAEQHQIEIAALKKSLKTFIELNKPMEKQDEMRVSIAKAYYLLADTMLYFEEKKEDAKPLFKKATELMPKNPYYRAHYYTLVEDEKQNDVAITEINNVGWLHLTNYNAYMKERWNAEKIMSKGFNVHTLPTETPGFFQRTFSFR